MARASIVSMQAGASLAAENHHHSVPTLQNQTTTVVTIKDNTVTLTFGPIDLPSGHDGDLAASMPKHVFQLPKDMYLVGYRSAVFTKEGKQLPQRHFASDGDVALARRPCGRRGRRHLPLHRARRRTDRRGHPLTETTHMEEHPNRTLLRRLLEAFAAAPGGVRATREVGRQVSWA